MEKCIAIETVRRARIETVELTWDFGLPVRPEAGLQVKGGPTGTVHSVVYDIPSGAWHVRLGPGQDFSTRVDAQKAVDSLIESGWKVVPGSEKTREAWKAGAA
jgi:hypothetical protein